jgi:hypothetical protein
MAALLLLSLSDAINNFNYPWGNRNEGVNNLALDSCNSFGTDWFRGMQ